MQQLNSESAVSAITQRISILSWPGHNRYAMNASESANSGTNTGR